jgi:tRNA A-37 threonylcarbamoyl transferase component Bud32
LFAYVCSIKSCLGHVLTGTSNLTSGAQTSAQEDRRCLEQANADTIYLAHEYPRQRDVILEAVDKETADSIRESLDSAISDTEFTFDDEIVTSKVYRIALAQAKNKNRATTSLAAESDTSIDPSDAETIRPIPEAVNCSVSDVPEHRTAPVFSESLRHNSTSSQRLERLETPQLELIDLGISNPGTHALDTATVSMIKPVSRRRTQIDTNTGRWLMGRTIGRGSSAKIKLAKNLETGEICALKIVPRQFTGEHVTQLVRGRVDHAKDVQTAREAAICTLMNHPFICSMRDIVRTQHHWYFVIEHIDGGSLADYVTSRKRLTENQARRFARQLISALDYCHRNSIVHHHIHPENIMISRSGDVKLIGFGSSTLFLPNLYLHASALPESVEQSTPFTAPEISRNEKYLGPEVDVWSIGAVLHFMVTGKLLGLEDAEQRSRTKYPQEISMGKFA